MKVWVSLMGELGKLAKARPLAVELEDGADLRSLIRELDRLTSSPVSSAILVQGERIASAYSVMCNGANVLLGCGLATVLNDGDQVAVMPKVAGGVG